MTPGPLDRAVTFWKPLMEPQALLELATYREPDEPRVTGINVWRSSQEPSSYRVAGGGEQFSLFAAVHPIDHIPSGAEVLAHILDREANHYSYVLWFPDERSIVVPFDPNAAIEALWREEYIPADGRTALPRHLLSLYYWALKPLLRGPIKGRLRRAVARRAFAGERFLEWPSDESLDSLQRLLLRLILIASDRRELPFIWFWPDKHPWAAVLTHDVETAPGVGRSLHVAELERKKGLRSSFNLVPLDYEVPGSLLDGLREGGFEIGIHGYTHDGLLFSKWSTFLKRAVVINEVGRQLGASGFRSPATYRNHEWFHLLEFEYDSSISDVAPFEPQPGGCASLFPFPLLDLIELPITVTQDHTLFGLLGQTNAEHWLTKLRRIRGQHGMACVLTHPDPAHGYIGLPENQKHYEELLDAITDSDAWTPLPRDLARWWRARIVTTPDQVGDLEGASLGTAVLDDSDHLDIVPPRGSDLRPQSDRRSAGVQPSSHNGSIRVWIDMANSPHVQFFGPLIRELESRGHYVLITARDFAQTTQLLDQAGLDYTAIGHHGGKSTIGKLFAIEGRARSLAVCATEHKVDIAVHHNSYAQSIAARSMGIPSVTLMDYEYQPANHVGFRLSSIVLVPESISARALAPYGAGWRLRRYPGLKEDFYVASMLTSADTSPLIEGLDADRPLLILRPPPDLAAYHRLENALWIPLLRYLADQRVATVLVLPRTKEQAARLVAEGSEDLVVADRAIAPAALLARADGVITAGGTMAREAAALGIPAYTLFAGRRGGVDTHLINEGRLIELSTPEDFERISLKRLTGDRRGNPERESERVNWLMDLIEHAAR